MSSDFIDQIGQQTLAARVAKVQLEDSTRLTFIVQKDQVDLKLFFYFHAIRNIKSIVC